MFDQLAKAGRYLGQTMRSMVGMPEYSVYLEHMEKNHPGTRPMSYEEFFRERQEARYGANGRAGKCC